MKLSVRNVIPGTIVEVQKGQTTAPRRRDGSEKRRRSYGK
jgi:hypothetical protein